MTDHITGKTIVKLIGIFFIIVLYHLFFGLYTLSFHHLPSLPINKYQEVIISE